MIKLTIIVGDNESSHEVFLSIHDLFDGASLDCVVTTTDKFLTIKSKVVINYSYQSMIFLIAIISI